MECCGNYAEVKVVRAVAAVIGVNYVVSSGSNLTYKAVEVHNRGAGKVYFSVSGPSSNIDTGGSIELLSGEKITVPVIGKDLNFQADAINTGIQVSFYR